jgi:hypothetical protein
VHAVVVLEPAAELAQHGGRVGAWVDRSIVALEGLVLSGYGADR